MTSVEEIENAIVNLSREEYTRLVEWFHERDQRFWDEQMDRDATAGKLDFIRREAREARQAGTVRDWPKSE